MGQLARDFRVGADYRGSQQDAMARVRYLSFYPPAR